ncbi:MAG: hypothetical protein ACJ72R_10145 [Nitrososphaeraceae archaeon]
MGGKSYSCTAEEFTNLGYDELIDLKTRFREYMKSKVTPRPQLKQGRVYLAIMITFFRHIILC